MENFNNFESKKPTQEIKSYLDKNNFPVSIEKPKYCPEKFNFERKIDNQVLCNYFEENNYIISKPIPIKLENATTLFVSAGIQKLENVIHREEEFPEVPIFVNQPVLRSQFIGSTAMESHTSFHHLSTIDINLNIENHLKHFQNWMDFLLKTGFFKDNFVFNIVEDTPKLGNIKYNNFIIKVFYAGLEIGDAVFIPSLPQKTRPAFSISDIGFGLERLNHNPNKINITENDYVKTLVLLGMSGVQPSNNEHGYRFRMFSKKLVSECKLDYSQLIKTLKNIPGFIELWMQVDIDVLVGENDIIDLISKECERNFNREVLNFLKENHNYQSEININQGTRNFLLQLKNIGDKSKEFWSNLEKSLFINNT